MSNVRTRRTTHSETLAFRINGTLVAAAETKAARMGMSLSEFLRDAVRREVRDDL